MARKSLELRLSQTHSLMEAFDTAGLKSDRSYRFMADMAYRMERGKGMSKGQRKYLDDLIDQGVPTPKNEERVKEILEAAAVDGMQQDVQTLKDFAYKLGKGWNLSEKQEKFLSILLDKSAKLEKEGRFRPSGNLLKDLEFAAAICAKKNGWYWQHRPGTAKAYNKVSEWLDWNRRNKLREDLLSTDVDESVIDSGCHVGDEPIIDEWVCNKLLTALKNPLKELNNPKHPAGSMVWKVMYNAPKSCALVTGLPTVKDGRIVYPCLVNGEDILVSAEDLRKRRG